MAKTHSSLTGADLHDNKGIGVETSANFMTISQSTNILSASAASTASFGRFEGSGDSHFSGSVTFGGDLTIGDAASDSVSITADLTSHLIPNADATYDLGSTSQGWNDLHLGSGGVINLDGGDVTMTHSANLVSIAGGNTRVIRLEIDGANDYLDVDTDLKIISAADVVVDPGGGELKVDGNVVPNSDSADSLGASGTAWLKLWVDDIDLAGQGSISMGGTAGRIDLDADDDTSIRSAADDVITFEAGAVDILEINATSISGSSISTGSFAALSVGSGSGAVGGSGNTKFIVAGNSEYTGNVSGSSASTGSFGHVYVQQDLTVGGDIILGDADTDLVTFGADIGSNLIPDADDTYDLGSATKAWQDLFLEGDITLTDAGTIATTAGAMTLTSAAAATWSTSAGALTIDGAGGLTLDSDGTDAVNLGTEAVAKTITIGNAASTKVDINAIALDFDSAAATDILAASTVSVKGATGASFGDDTGTWEFNGSGAVSETGMTTFSLTPSSTVDIDAGGAVTIDGTSITIGADDSGVAISIGHSTSETTVNDNLTITGNLTVNGDQTIVSTTNLAVEDKFAIFGSGSISAAQDGGIIVQNAATSGYGLGYDTGTSRWCLDNNLARDATNIVPDAYIGTVETGTTHGDAQSAPTYGSGVGSIYVDTDDNEIWIYA